MNLSSFDYQYKKSYVLPIEILLLEVNTKILNYPFHS